jgi:alanine dehydrogenase
VKVKDTERKKLRCGQIIFTYLHLAPDLNQAQDVMASGATAIAYETVTDAAGRLPLLAPMSKVAGRMAAQVAAHFLERPQGGRGVLLGAIDGFPAAEIMVLGGWRCRLQCRRDSARHGRQGDRHRPAGRNFKSTGRAIRRTRARHGGTTGCNCGALRFGRRCDWSCFGGRRCCSEADLGRYGHANEAGAVIVDISIDQGGCAETSHPTTHSRPTFVVDGIVHYCVANMPGAVPCTSTYALNNATRPFVLAFADKGFSRAVVDDVHLRNGVNVHDGKITCRAVADALQLPYTPIEDVLAE